MSNLTSTSGHEGRQPTMLESLTGVKFESLPSDVRRNFTKIDPRLPVDIKNIALWIKEEKNLVKSVQNVSNDRRGASKCFAIWGKESGDDISDVTEKLTVLMNRIADVEIVLAEKLEQQRKLLKDIREAEERLSVPRERKRKINEEIAKTIKSHPRSPRLRDLEEDLRRVKADSAKDEAEVGNIKRRKLKDAMIIYLGATFEAAEKIALISGFGWDLLSQIDITNHLPNEERPQYDGYQITEQVIKECQIALHRWQEPSYDIKPLIPGLTNTASAALDAQKQEYESKVTQLSNSMNSLKSEHDAAVAQFAANLESERKEYEKQVEEYASALADQKKAYKEQLDEISKELDSQRKSSEAKINELTNSLKEASAQKEQLETKRSSEVKSHEEQINQLSVSLGAQRKQYDEQLRRYNDLISQRDEYQSAVSERDALIAKLQSDINSVITEKEKLTSLVKDLEESLKSKTISIEGKDTKINRLEDDIAGIKNQLANLTMTSSQIPELSSPIVDRSHTYRHLTTSSSNELPPTSAVSNSSSSDQLENQNVLQRNQTIGPQFQQGFGNLPPSHQNTMYGSQQFYQQPFYQTQQPYYGQGPHPVQQPYGFQQQQMNYGPIPPSSQQQQQQSHPQGGDQPQGAFPGGFFVSNVPDEAPPAYDGPSGGYPDDKKEKS